MNKLVRIMIKERLLKEDRTKNKKKIRLFVNKNNFLGSVPQELEQFKSAFILLVDKTTEIIAPSIIKSAFEPESFALSHYPCTSAEFSKLGIEEILPIVVESLAGIV